MLLPVLSVWKGIAPALNIAARLGRLGEKGQNDLWISREMNQIVSSTLEILWTSCKLSLRINCSDVTDDTFTLSVTSVFILRCCVLYVSQKPDPK